MAKAPHYQIRNWGEFQHYHKGRTPPWIKLHRTLLVNREWYALSDGASRLLVECWLIASESSDGFIHMDATDIAWRLRRDEADTRKCLNELAAQRFLLVCEQDASAPLASGLQDACLDGDGDGEEREKKDPPSPPEGGKQPGEEEPAGKPKRARKRKAPSEATPMFVKAWEAYPPRAGGNSREAAWKAWQARLNQGATEEELLLGTIRYAAYNHAVGNTGTIYVKQAATFYGPSNWYKLPWSPPPPESGKPRPGSEASGIREERPQSPAPRSGADELDVRARQDDERVRAWSRQNPEAAQALWQDVLDGLQAFGGNLRTDTQERIAKGEFRKRVLERAA